MVKVLVLAIAMAFGALETVTGQFSPSTIVIDPETILVALIATVAVGAVLGMFKRKDAKVEAIRASQYGWMKKSQAERHHLS